MKATDNIDYDFTHDHAGNGWAIVQNLGDNFWRVVAIGRESLDTRVVPMAWGKKLTRSLYPISDKPNAPLEPRKLTGKLLDQARELREQLATGKMHVFEQHLRDGPAPEK